jgi:hypothetical protein
MMSGSKAFGAAGQQTKKQVVVTAAVLMRHSGTSCSRCSNYSEQLSARVAILCGFIRPIWIGSPDAEPARRNTILLKVEVVVFAALGTVCEGLWHALMNTGPCAATPPNVLKTSYGRRQENAGF